MIVVMAIVLGGIAFLLGRQVYREFKKAIKKDAEENTTKYLRNVIIEYAIVAVVCIVAVVLVNNFKDSGFLYNISHRLYGGPVQNTTPTINPFSR
jgi:hypothetical protein